ncbi:MAG: porin family protein [Janthinobacterium lividum]
MKPLFTLAFGLLALAARQGRAQETPTLEAPVVPRPHALLINLKGGLNLTTYTGGGYIGWDTGLTTGFSAGFSGTQRLSARTAWQVELVYSGKGVQQDNYWYQYAGPVPPTKPQANVYEAALHYLDLPVLFSYGPGSGSRHGWFIVAGPQLSLALDKQETVRPMGISDADDYRETLNGDAKSLTRWGTGYVAGVGYQVAGGGAGIELRYSGDFSTVYRDGYGSGALYPGSSNRFHNGVIMVQINIALRGGKWRWDWGHGGSYPYPHPDSSPTPEPRSRPQSFPRAEPTPRPKAAQ